jgi:hypothetical protein
VFAVVGNGSGDDVGASEEYQLEQQSALWWEPQLEHLYSL